MEGTDSTLELGDEVPLPGVTELVEGAECGCGEGICGTGLTCMLVGDTATCVPLGTPYPDEDGSDADTADVVPDVMDEPFPEDVDFPDEPSPDADPD